MARCLGRMWYPTGGGDAARNGVAALRQTSSAYRQLTGREQSGPTITAPGFHTGTTRQPPRAASRRRTSMDIPLNALTNCCGKSGWIEPLKVPFGRASGQRQLAMLPLGIDAKS